MCVNHLSARFAAITLIIAFAVFCAGVCAVAQQETVLHNFNDNGTDGYQPTSGLALDAAGNLYGETPYGGAYAGVDDFRSGGTAFELKRTASGWAEEILHNFGNGTDGQFPARGAILDASGNLFGTTSGGGTYGNGTVFKLTLASRAETILYNFGAISVDGIEPGAGLISDKAGNLYGTTSVGGTASVGTVFELIRQEEGGWVEKVLHSFAFNEKDGRYPGSTLLFDAAGNLYGTTSLGGAYDSGTVFKLTPSASGEWTEKVLYTFDYKNSGGADPSSLIFDDAGNLYGTANYGPGTGCGGSGCGTVFELTPASGGGLTEQVLHSFADDGSDGYSPLGSLVFDASGNLYGTTIDGGTYGWGTVFKLAPSTGGWTETIVHSFGSGQDGQFPYSSLVIDASGNLYGTTFQGGTSGACIVGCGTVFEIKP